MKTSLAKFKEEFGGESFLEPKGYSFLFVMSLVASATVITDTDSFEKWVGTLVASLFSLLVCSVWYLLGVQLFFANRQSNPVGLFSMLAFGLVLGATKGFTTGLFMVILGIESGLTQSATSRLPSAIFFGVVGVLGLTITQRSLDRLRVERHQLISQLERQSLATKISKYRDAAIAELSNFVNIAKSHLVSDDETGITGTEYSTRLKNIVDSELRPLSHRLWNSSQVSYPDFTFRDLLGIALTKVSPNPLIVAGVYFLGVAFSLINRLPFDSAFIISISETVIVLLGSLLVRFIKPGKFKLALTLFCLSSFAIGLIAYYETVAIGIIPSELSHWTAALGTVLWFTEVNFLTRFIGATILNSKNIRRASELLLENGELEQLAKENNNLLEQREMADFLHGKLQNALLATALRLDTAKSEDDDSHIERRYILQMLDNVVPDYVAITDLDFVKHLSELQDRWSGYANLTWKISGNIDLINENAHEALCKLANEALNNATRHGLAENIDLRIEIHSPMDFTFLAVDDGLGPRSDSPGLGSQLFTSIGGTNWSITALPDGGTQLLVQFSLV